MKKIFKGLLIVVLLLSFVFVKADDERDVVSRVVLTSDMSVPSYGGQVKNYYTYTTEEGLPAYMTPHMGDWYIKRDGNFYKYNDGVFKEGTYKYLNQVRIDGSDGTTHRFSEDLTVSVDEREWTLDSTVDISSTYCMAYFWSPEFTVELIEDYELTFYSLNFRIYTNYVNQPIDSFSVANSVLGGKGSYTFSKTSGPSWVNVSADGVISGTPNAYGTNANLVVRVTDEEESYKEISIPVAKTDINPSDREDVSRVVITSNMEVPTYMGEVKNYYTYTTVEGLPAYMSPHMGDWYYLDGETYRKYNESQFEVGTYKYLNQVRLDDEGGKTHKFTSDLTISVDGREWTLHSTIDISNTYCMAYFWSPEFVVEKPAIENPTVTLTSNNNVVTLTWDKQLVEEKANIYRSLDGKKYSKVDTVETNSYSDSGLTYGKTYYYKVKVYGSSKWSGFSNVVKKKVLPNKVLNLHVISAGSNNVKLGYDKVSASGYEIHSSTNNKKFSKVATVSKNSILEYDVKKLKANKTYYFKVRAYKTVSGSKVYGTFSDVLSIKTAPDKPSLSLSLKSLDEMNLKIGASSGASLYQVEKSLDGKAYTSVIELPEAGMLIQPDLEIGKTYYFRVRACNSESRCSGWTKASLKMTTKAPSLSLKTTSGKIIATIKSVEGADGYQLYMSMSRNEKYQKVKEFKNKEDLMKYTMKTYSGFTYYFKVRSYKMVDDKPIYSPYSSIKSIRSK